MKKMTNLLTAVFLCISMLFTPMQAMAAVNSDCECSAIKERLERQLKEEKQITLFGNEVMLFRVKCHVDSVPEKYKEGLKKAIFLGSKKKTEQLIILECSECGQLFIVPFGKEISSGSQTGSSNTGTSTGGDSSSTGSTSTSKPNGGNTGGGSSSGDKPSGGDSSGGKPGDNTDNKPSEKPGDNTGGDSGEQKPGEKPGDNNEDKIIEIDISKLVVSDKEVTYSPDAEQGLYIGKLPEGLKLSYYLVNGEVKPVDYLVSNAGKYEVVPVFEVTDDKYKIVGQANTAILTINKAKYEGAFNFDKTSFAYDGKGHAPVPSNLPEGAKILTSSNSQTSAGKYTHDMEIEISPNYETVKVSTEYEITPSKLSLQQQYNDATGKVESIVEGLVDGDLKDLIYTVNGSESSEAPEILEPGRYEIKTELILNEDKKQNYTGGADEIQTALEKIYEAKRKDTWYKPSMESTIENGKLVINIFLSDIKVQTQEEMGYVLFTLGFNVKYDKNVLQYDRFEAEADDLGNGFDGAYNPDRGPSGEADERDAVLSFFADTIADTVKVCTLVYDIDPSAEDVSISLEDFVLATGEEDNPFEYTSNNSTIVVNPSEDYVAPEEILIDWDPMKDANYIGDEDEEAAAREELQDYIDEKFPVTAGAEVVTSNLSEVETEVITTSEIETGSAIGIIEE